MNNETEPTIKKSACQYCGDAGVNHMLSYTESLITIGVDRHMQHVAKHAPQFLKDFAEWLPLSLFHILALFKKAEFSDDIEKACSFRSRIIWEEARARGITMQQLVIFGKPLDHYRATINGKEFYFESIPIPPQFQDMEQNWDDKIVLKNEFAKHNIPIPTYKELSFLHLGNLEGVFNTFTKPIIVKPRVGSRGRHTVTNIHTLAEFREGVDIVKKLCPYISVEEHLFGSICRATVIGGTLAGFYQGVAPSVVGDGKKTIQELIHDRDNARNARVEEIRMTTELHDYIARSGYSVRDVLPSGVALQLSHHVGRLFGGTTKEMIDELHPSFVPILEKAAKVIGLSIAGFDCIIPDPTKPADSQRWGIIECNTLPFIDLHYFALEGKPRNIAAMVWDLWK